MLCINKIAPKGMVENLAIFVSFRNVRFFAVPS